MLKISRRRLLQSAGIAAAAAAVGNIPADAFAKGKNSPAANDGWHYGHCRMCMRGDCPMMYRVENGIVVELRGNPASPSNRGALCARGNSLIQNLYNPYRVKKPMKRTNPKKGIHDDPKWVEITWEEALSATSSVLKKTREKDPRRFIFQVGFGDMDYFCTFLFYFADAYGTPNYLKSNGTLCAVHYAADMTQGVFPVTVADISRGRFVLSLGRHTGMSIAEANGVVRDVFDAIEDGVRFVTVDPRCSPEASKGEWVPIKPGTDLAFLMSFAHVMLYEIKKLDIESLRWATNAPYLIGKDGDYYRGKDGKPQIYDKSDKKVKSFDDKTLKTPELEVRNMKIDNNTVNSSFVLVKDNLKNNTPEWAEKICNVSAAKIRSLAKEFVASASLGKTVTLKDGKGEDRVFPLRTSCVVTNRGVMNSRDGIHCDLMSKVINQLVGSLDVPGGNLGCIRGPRLSPDADGVVAPKMEAVYNDPVWPPQHVNLYEFFPHKHTMPTFAYKVAKEPKKYGLEYEIDALLTVGGNPITSSAEPDATAESVAKIPFSANIAYHYDEMAHLADILLPSHAILERLSVNCFEFIHDVFTKNNIGSKMLMYRDPFPAVYDTRQPQDIIMEISERIGMIGDFNSTVNKMGVMIGETTVVPMVKEDYLALNKRYPFKEILDRGIKNHFGRQYNIDDLKKTGLIIDKVAPAECYNTYHFAKGETRFPFYFIRTKRSGDGLRKFFNAHKDKIYLPGYDMEDTLQYFEPVIKWRPNIINSVKDGDEYNLVAINWKIPASHMKIGGIDQLPYLNEIGERFDPTYNAVCLNTVTAGEYGMKEGDIITVESPTGKVTGRLHVTELIVPKVVGIAGALGRATDTLGPKAGGHIYYNRLISADLSSCDPISMGLINNRPVKIYKAVN